MSWMGLWRAFDRLHCAISQICSPLQILENILGRLEAETVPFLLVRLQYEGVRVPR